LFSFQRPKFFFPRLGQNHILASSTLVVNTKFFDHLAQSINSLHCDSLGCLGRNCILAFPTHVVNI